MPDLQKATITLTPPPPGVVRRILKVNRSGTQIVPDLEVTPVDATLFTFSSANLPDESVGAHAGIRGLIAGDVLTGIVLDYDSAGNESPASDEFRIDVTDTTPPPKPATPTFNGVFIQE